MTTSAASEAIARLIEMAEQGEINPWDVAVIDVIDRFLQEVGVLSSLDLAYQQRHLSKSGQAFLWASMLVRYKADTLEFLGQAEEESPDLELETPEDSPLHSLPLHLEQHLRRRTSVPPLRKRRVTLEELISQIQQIATEIDENKAPKRLKRVRPQSRREALQIISELAHHENLTALAQQLEEFLHTRLPETVVEYPWIDLETLVQWWHQHQSLQEQTSKQDKVGVFWALLLLSSQSKVELSQETFYQDLKVQVIVQ